VDGRASRLRYLRYQSRLGRSLQNVSARKAQEKAYFQRHRKGVLTIGITTLTTHISW